MALSLVGGAFAFTGCTDYEDDINKLNDRLDALETGTIADVQEQMTTLQSALDQANQTISGLEGNVNDLSGALETLQGSVDGLGGTVDGLQGAVNAIDERLKTVEAFSGDIDALKAAVEEITASLGDYATKDDVAATYATKEAVALLSEKLTAVESQLTDFAAEMTSLSGRVSSLEGKDAELDAAIAAVKTTAESAVAAAAKAQETADNALKTAQDALGQIASLKEALKTYATKGELEAAVEKIDSLDSAIDDELAAKLDASEFNAKFDEALKSAIEDNDGMVNQAIAQAIADATDEYNKNLDEVKARVNALVGKVEDLAKRIQSLVFVPEYDDEYATVTSYTFNTEPFPTEETATSTITATFKVTPAEYAEQLVAQAADVAFVQLLPVKTRAAAASVNIPSENVTVSKGAGEGYVNVVVVVPTSTFFYDNDKAADYKNYRVALYVADPSVVDAVEDDPNADINGIDAGSYISSDYVALANNDVDLAERYVIYNPETEKAFAKEDAEVEVPYVTAPGEKVFYHGYALYLNLGTTNSPEYVTLAEAAARIGVDEAVITPKYRLGKPVYDINVAPGANVQNPITDDKGNQLFTVDVAEFGPSIAMAKESSFMKDYVTSSVTVSEEFYFEKDDLIAEFIPVTKDIVLSTPANTFKYTVSNEEFGLTLDSKKVDWTYETIVGLSDGVDQFVDEYELPAGVPTIKDYAKDPIRFREVSGELTLPDGFNLRDVITDQNVLNKEVTVTVDGKEVTPAVAPELKLTEVASEQGKIARVQVSGYEFAQGKETVYSFKNVYSVNREVNGEVRAIDFTVKFELTLGAAPEDQTVDLGTIEVPFTNSSERHDNVPELHQKAYAPVAGYFGNDFDNFRVAFNNLNVDALSTQAKAAYDVEGATIPTSETRLTVNMMKEENKTFVEASDIVFFNAVMKQYDKFYYKTTVDTWFGVEYNFIAEADVVEPAYTLTFAPDLVTNGKAIVPGILDQNGYFTLNTVDLRNYVRVEGMVKDAEGNTPGDVLTVKYTVKRELTDEEKADGAKVPTLSSSTSSVTAGTFFGTVSSNVVNWGNVSTDRRYVRDIQIEVSLVMDGVNNPLTTQTLTIEAVDPITVGEGETIKISRKPGSSATANLWTGMVIYGADRTYTADSDRTETPAHKEGDSINLVNQKAATIDNMFFTTGCKHDPYSGGYNAVKGYGIYYSADEYQTPGKFELVSVTVDGVQISEDNYVFNAEAGTLTYTGNDASLQGKTVVAEVEYSFNHYLSAGVAKTAKVTVEFTDAE